MRDYKLELFLLFQSTLPVRGATDGYKNLENEANISIHAPREGSDPPLCIRSGQAVNFNPRSP